MKKDNLFYIVISSYNNSDWVDVNINSVLNQTYSNYKVIYVDDASTDDTYNKVLKLVQDNTKFTIIRNDVNIKSTANHIKVYDSIQENNSIVVSLDGDDWFATDDVLQKLNDFYNAGDYWMTYGGMLVYTSNSDIGVANPQNTEYSDFVHKHKLYRRDTWRASHLRTFKKFLWDNVEVTDMYSSLDGEPRWHAADLQEMFMFMEMCPQEKIGVVDFYTYMWNNSKKNSERTNERESIDNTKYETEIRNKKIYNYIGTTQFKKLPQINAFSDYRERNSIPTKYSIVYNQSNGEFDITILQDSNIIKYLNNEIQVSGKVIADIHEPIQLFEQKEVYKQVIDNYTKFDRILSYDEDILKLPNSLFRMGGGEVVLNKNVHKQEYPLLQDNSLIQIYDKTKLCSIISSNKAFCKGHIFRIECVNEVLRETENVDMYGVGFNEIPGKISGLKDYMFSVAMENDQHNNYFTEKILDCFLTGTIPIYHGCPNISKFFNTDGFFTFETKEELVHIIRYEITPDEYEKRKPIIKENFDLAMKYWYDNDRYFDMFIKDLI